MLYSQIENFLAFSGLYLKKATRGLWGDYIRTFMAWEQRPIRSLKLSLFIKSEPGKVVSYTPLLCTPLFYTPLLCTPLCAPLNEVFSTQTSTSAFMGAVV